MSTPSIQLDLEKANKSYIGSLAMLSAGRTILAAHEISTAPDGTFLLIICDIPPDWKTMVINAVVPVRFEFATAVKNPDTRAAAAAAHGLDTGKLIELFSEQNFAATLAALNAPAAGPDNRTWKGLGFTGWEAAGEPDADGTTDTQIVTRLPYIFEVFLED